MTSSILIPASALDKTMKRLSRLAKQAHVTLTEVPGSTFMYRKTRQWRERRDQVTGRVLDRWQVIEVDQNVVLECARVTVGELPSQNGHTFLGKIVHTEAGNMLQLAPHAQSEEFPAEWKTAKPTCDHCKTKRSRKDTFIIRTPDQKIMRVGRNCLADFLKVDPAEMVAVAAFQDAYLSIVEDDGEEGGWGSSGGWGPSLWHFLVCSFASVRKNGFIKACGDGDGEPSKTPTKSDAFFLANPCPKDNSYNQALKKAWTEGQPIDVDYADAVGALIWLEQNTDESQYIHNLTVACSLPGIRRENQGLVASLPAAYNRAMGKIALRKAERAASAQSKHMGTVGERLEVEATILTVQPLESMSRWGGSDLIKMVTDDGCVLVTFTTSASSPRQRDVGKRYSVKGTVKKHDNYKGSANTQLTRCAFTCLETEETAVVS